MRETFVLSSRRGPFPEQKPPTSMEGAFLAYGWRQPSLYLASLVGVRFLFVNVYIQPVPVRLSG